MSIPNNFVGRKQELQLLSELTYKNSASLVVIYGRRRVGKSRLIEEFGKNKKLYSFAGLYPEKNSTNEDQLTAFYNRFKMLFSTKAKPFQDWSEAFYHLAKQTQRGNIVILLDEISWMGAHDSNFLGKLKNAWDLEFKKNSNLIVILCGSVSNWIEKQLLANKGFYGRISLKIRLMELSLPESNNFFLNRGGAKLSSYEKIKILAVTGGIPKYLEEINPNQSADENIRRLCFTPSGLLFNDYNYIFSSMLERKSDLYQRIAETLCNHHLQRDELLSALNKKSGGLLTAYIDELETAGFISRDFTWNLKTGDLSKLSQYRLSDNYIRFYIKYLLPIYSKINKNKYDMRSLSSLPGWASIMGIQVENLVLNNRKAIQKLIGINPDEVICDGPFFQRTTARVKGCQIDYLIQTKSGILYVCEIKFTRHILRANIIEEVKNKIERLSTPKNLSIIPVLIHIGDIHDEVIDSQFFGKIINLSLLLEK